MSKAIVVLGSPNDNEGNLLPIAVSRADAAFAAFERYPESKILCTGGYGEHFNTTNMPHAQYLEEYLMAKGVPNIAFCEMALSAYTLEDAILSQPILAQAAIKHCIVVTSDFHMERVKLVFNRVMPNMSFDFVSAETPVNKNEFDKLLTHEKKAIKRELANLNKLSV